jgi:predicted RNase H-like HicB family nuclease
MKYRAVIKKSGNWWIGWLVDLPGVNAQERTRNKLIESLRIGAAEMLATEIPFEPDSQMLMLDVPAPAWAIGAPSAV